VINQHCHKIADRFVDSIALYDDIQQLAFLVCRDGGILPNPAEFNTLVEQGRNLPQSAEGAARVHVGCENHVREGSGVGTGDRSHV
jgi:hypothetical protein